MFLLISKTHANLEYKGVSRVHGCTGECYAEYVAINGTVVDIERENKNLQTQTNSVLLEVYGQVVCLSWSEW